MPVAGLVLTLHKDLTEEVLARLSDDPRVTVGEPARERLPVVTDTGSLDETLELWDALQNVPGVLALDLVFEDFSDVDVVEAHHVARKAQRGGTPWTAEPSSE